MADDNNRQSTAAQLRESEGYLRKAYHLANFGTLTSLVSTGAYFAEQTMTKARELPAMVKKATLASIGIGIASVVASYYYSLKAGSIALKREEALNDERQKDIQAPASSAPPAKWVEKCADQPKAAQQTLG